MKKLLSIFVGACIYLHAGAQLVQTKIDQYFLPADKDFEKTVIIRMPYAGYSFENISGDTTALRNAGAMIIDVVCTDYPTEQSLAKLNNNRLKALRSRFPFINDKQIKQLNCYRQVKGTEKERATLLFHGIVIRYRATQINSRAGEEINKLDSLLNLHKRKTSKQPPPSLRGDDIPATPYYNPSKKPTPDKDGKVPYSDPSMSLKGKRVTHIIGDTGYINKYFIIPDSAELLDYKTAYKRKLISKVVYQRFKDKDRSHITLYQPLPEELPELPADSTDITVSYAPEPPLPDSAIVNTFSRNRWSNQLIVADVTGSMYPYTAQLLLWLQLHTIHEPGNRFVFYNDGDDKEDDKKKTGKTGGIYMQQCNRYEEVEALVKLAMQKGCGGDLPENTAEALIVARQRFPDARSMILIADNWADIRDKILISSIRIPVKVIVCGVHGNDINTDYLDLALLTGGSVHTMEEDITSIASMHEGDSITIGKRKYTIRNGKFEAGL